MPNVNDPSGSYSGGAFTTSRARSLTGYNALRFWAKASRAVTLDVVGLGNDNTGTSKYEARMNALNLTTTWTQFTIPIPLASKLSVERGLFYFAEGPEGGAGCTMWFDDVQFVLATDITNPRPAIDSRTLNLDVGTTVPVSGARVVFSVAGLDRTVLASPRYFSYESSNPSVAAVNDEQVDVVGVGSTVITASLGGLPATGSIDLTTSPAPATAAPTPTVPAADVISLFSNAYTNVPVDKWSADWDIADVSDVLIAGNAAKKYTNFVYAGIEFITTTVNATAMTHVHADVWAAEGTVFRIKLVDFGANGVFGGGDDTEHELTFNASTTPAFTTGGWASLDIPLSAFTGLTTRGHLAQIVLSGDTPTVYVDNLYFHR